MYVLLANKRWSELYDGLFDIVNGYFVSVLWGMVCIYKREIDTQNAKIKSAQRRKCGVCRQFNVWLRFLF